MNKTAEKTVVTTTIKKGEIIKRFLDIVGATFVGLTATTEYRMNKGGRSGVAVNIHNGNVVKDSKVGGVIGADYTNMVNNALARESKEDIASIVFTFDNDLRESMLDFGIAESDIVEQESNITADIKDKALYMLENHRGEVFEPFVAGKRSWGEHFQIGVKFNVDTLENEPILSKIVIDHTKDGEHRFYLQLFVLSSQKPTYRFKDSGKELSETELDYCRQYVSKSSDGKNQGLRSPIIVRDYRIDNLKTITVNKTKYSINS